MREADRMTELDEDAEVVLEEIAGAEFTEGFARAMWIGAALLVVGAVLAWTLLAGTPPPADGRHGGTHAK